MPYVCALGPLLRPHQEEEGGPIVLKPISENGHDHITISYRTELYDNTDALEYWPNSIEIEVLHESTFGEYNNIPVYLVRFVDDQIAMEMHRFHYLTEVRQSDEFKPPYFSPHISRKHLTSQLALGDRLWVSRIFIKKVFGVDYAPLYERKLNPVPRQG